MKTRKWSSVQATERIRFPFDLRSFVCVVPRNFFCTCRFLSPLPQLGYRTVPPPQRSLVLEEIELKTKSPSNPENLPTEGEEEKKHQFYCWISIKPGCDPHSRPSTKRLQRQKEISAFYITKHMTSYIHALEVNTSPYVRTITNYN